jgi:ribosomal protein S18 acetylase RimI-like enzyme
MEIRRIGEVAAVEAAGHLFDKPVRPDAAERFLNDERHHLLIAYEDGAAAGMITGVEMTHPDKGTEMFLYELGVDAPFRQRGIGQALVTALAELARERGCYGMWVITDDDNAAARAVYGRITGGTPQGSSMVQYHWEFGER